MLDSTKAVREGRQSKRKIKTVACGYHTHKVVDCEPYYIGAKLMTYKSVQERCGTCARENELFMRLWLHREKKGGFALEGRMNKLESYRAYNQKWPFDARKMVLSNEVVFEDNEGAVYVEGFNPASTLSQMIDAETTEELLCDLSPEERFVIDKTVGDYKPREIAAMLGYKDSNRVRQVKYAALRKLGAPINTKMRRVP